ncbi:hypothetical protein GRF29_44g1701472 [Pseudopithomyces chartarum]|uniref:CENP-V/GFA domain-containing protein n=1 Tax=Pseudopithomyces chartarum TaxID=1892770 RepID=A0AAN6M1T3_9PLEO|nr:hypothetical protein GRF29_44g1701472 [Pseudopithomyces chartarum]
MAQQGGCVCGNIRFAIEGEPVAKALCHCRDCRKISGSAYSTNATWPENQFKLNQGTPKTHVKTADSGNTITSFFCGDCGSTMWRETAAFEGVKIVKVGTLDDDDALNAAKPANEFFISSRVSWLQAIPDAEQKETM